MIEIRLLVENHETLINEVHATGCQQGEIAIATYLLNQILHDFVTADFSPDKNKDSDKKKKPNKKGAGYVG